MENVSITETSDQILCQAHLPIKNGYTFQDKIFDSQSPVLIETYKEFGRCLAIVDHNVLKLMERQIAAYFQRSSISVKLAPLLVTEDRKDMDKVLEVCQIFKDFDLLRREPILAIGGGLLTDIVGFAGSMYRRGSQYIRVPTTLVGLIDASVSNRVGVSWNGLKNRLGAFHEPVYTIIDRSFLEWIPDSEIRNGLAEVIKINSCVNIDVFNIVKHHGLDLIKSRFATVNNSVGDSSIATKVIRQTILEVLRQEIPNAREQVLDRVMYFGHTWSPVLELEAEPILLHGHAISVDMAFSAVLAYQLGKLTHDSMMVFLKLFSDLGLCLNHPAFTLELMKTATSSCILTRNGLLRAPIPTKILGTYEIVANVEMEILEQAWAKHRELMGVFPRGGLGLEYSIVSRVAEKD